MRRSERAEANLPKFGRTVRTIEDVFAYLEREGADRL